MANAPAFASTPRIGRAAISTANTNADGTGTIADVLTGVAAGTKVNEVVVQATGATTSGTVRLYVYDGTNTDLFDEVIVTVVASPGAGTARFRSKKTYDNLVLPSASHKLQASTHNAETFKVIALAADLT